MPDDTKGRDSYEASSSETEDRALSRRNILLGSSALMAAATITSGALAQTQKAAPAPAPAAPAAPSGRKPNILVIWGDDIGIANISAYSNGLMGYETPSIDRIAREGLKMQHYYGEQSCTAGRAAFLTGQHGIRTGLTKVGFPGAPMGMSQLDPSVGGLLKNLGYATGQFGKNHVGDRNESLPTVNGFDEFFGNLYHLNADAAASVVPPSRILRRFMLPFRGSFGFVLITFSSLIASSFHVVANLFSPPCSSEKSNMSC